MALLTGDSSVDGARIRKNIHTLLKLDKTYVPPGMYLQVGYGFSYAHTTTQDEYLNAIAEDLVWGGLPEIKIYSTVTPIVVFEDRNTPRLFQDGKEVPINWSNLPSKTIFLAFYGNHYAALAKK